jgi:hypothetical protein
MTKWTDKTIPIKCAECEEEEEGLSNMIAHILIDHPNYTPKQAVDHAETWMENAYENDEEFMADYYKQRKEDPSE